MADPVTNTISLIDQNHIYNQYPWAKSSLSQFMVNIFFFWDSKISCCIVVWDCPSFN